MAAVFDCSALASYLLDEPSLTPGVRAAVEKASAGQVEARAPGILAWEFANVLAVGLKTGRLREEEAAEAARLLAEFPVMLVAMETEACLDLAERAAKLGLSAYDAAYLLLAKQLGASLVTLDSGLARTAMEAGVEVAAQP